MPLNSIYSVNLWIKSSSCPTWLWFLVCLNMDTSTWVTVEGRPTLGYWGKNRMCSCIFVTFSLFKWKLDTPGAFCFFYLHTQKSHKVTEELYNCTLPRSAGLSFDRLIKNSRNLGVSSDSGWKGDAIARSQGLDWTMNSRRAGLLTCSLHVWDLSWYIVGVQ